MNCNKYLKQKWGYIIENKKFQEFKNKDIWDILNEPVRKALIEDQMDQKNINKHLLTAILTINNKVDANSKLINSIINSNKQSGSSYVVENERFQEFKNKDIWDTLNEPVRKALIDGIMNQQNINKHLLTAILTINNKVDANSKLINSIN